MMFVGWLVGCVVRAMVFLRRGTMMIGVGPNKKKKKRPKILEVVSGSEGQLVRFECSRRREWLAFVRGDDASSFDVQTAGTVGSEGPVGITMAFVGEAGSRAPRTDVTTTILQLYGPRGDFHGLPAPRLRDVLPFLVPGSGDDLCENENARMWVWCIGRSGPPCMLFGPDDEISLN